MNKAYRVSDICKKIDEKYQLHGASDDIVIDKIATPYQADEHTMVFISPDRSDKQALFDHTKACLIIADHSIQYQSILPNKCLIAVDHPKRIFAKLGNEFFLPTPTSGIHPTAIIHPEAVIGKNIYIGPNTYIGQCEIGENVRIDGHCYLYDDVFIGQHVNIQAGCVIGASGCGFIKDQHGRYQNFPHIGKVIIESHVNIGPHTCIAKGALSDTIVKIGTVIDSFVQVGHNVLIEENVLILANSVIGGSSIIKKNSILAIGSHICDYVIVGEAAHIGPGAVIMSDVAAFAKVVQRPPLTLAQQEMEKSN